LFDKVLAEVIMARISSPPAYPQEAFENSVIDYPTAKNSNASLTFMFADVAERITPWGLNTKLRDSQLRKFWPTENMLAGAVASVCMRNSAFDFKIEARTVIAKKAAEFVLHNAISPGGVRGWQPFISAITNDLMTQDNGAHFEIIRADNNSPTSPCVGISHLDSNSCTRTGDPKYPVVYEDRNGKFHKLAWWQVVSISDLPSPIEKMNGVGLCAVSRVLRAAEILKDLSQYKSEKISGRFARAIHIVGGVGRSDLDDIQTRDNERADNMGLKRFIMPMILASLDPEKPVSHVEIPLASLPDGFNLDVELKWYIAELALGFGVDYQDFAPLPGGNLGTSTQSEVLHRKSRGKGPAWFMETIEDIFEWYGIFPRGVEFEFEDQDLVADKEKAMLSEIRARERALRVRSGEITPEVSRRIALRNNDLIEEDISGIDFDLESNLLSGPKTSLDAAGNDTLSDIEIRDD
jgi:hypothetical protein